MARPELTVVKAAPRPPALSLSRWHSAKAALSREDADGRPDERFRTRCRRIVAQTVGAMEIRAIVAWVRANGEVPRMTPPSPTRREPPLVPRPEKAPPVEPEMLPTGDPAIPVPLDPPAELPLDPTEEPA